MNTELRATAANIELSATAGRRRHRAPRRRHGMEHRALRLRRSYAANTRPSAPPPTAGCAALRTSRHWQGRATLQRTGGAAAAGQRPAGRQCHGVPVDRSQQPHAAAEALARIRQAWHPPASNTPSVWRLRGLVIAAAGCCGACGQPNLAAASGRPSKHRLCVVVARVLVLRPFPPACCAARGPRTGGWCGSAGQREVESGTALGGHSAPFD